MKQTKKKRRKQNMKKDKKIKKVQENSITHTCRYCTGKINEKGSWVLIGGKDYFHRHCFEVVEPLYRKKIIPNS